MSAKHRYFCYPRIASNTDLAVHDYYLPKEVVDYRKADLTLEKSLPPPTKEGYIVVGGSGFVGGHLLKSLIQRGEDHVVNMDLGSPKVPLPASVHFIKADITDYAELEKAFDAAIKFFDQRGVKLTTVFMTAAIIRFQDRYSFQYPRSYNVNVRGTENVIKACSREGSTVRYLIQTSTSHVAIGYDRSGYNITEDDPYSSRPFSHYHSTKILAEKIALASNDTPIPGSSHSLLTASIRPCSAIFGPHDTYFIDSLLQRSRAQVSSFIRIGPQYRMDWLYVGNLTYSFSLLERALRDDPVPVAGQAFNIGNDANFSNLEGHRRLLYFLPTVSPLIFLSSIHATLLAKIADVAQLLGIPILVTTSSAAWDMARINLGFSCEKAKRLLGYRPIYTFDEAAMKSFAIVEEEDSVRGN